MAILALIFNAYAFTPKAVAASVTEQFSTAETSSEKTIDHSDLSKLLQAYVKRDNAGLNRVDYKSFKNSAPALNAYINKLQQQKVTRLNKNEQFAYWSNLYNALTIKVILDAYPVRSIKDIDISPGLFADGPWGKKLIKIEGTEISLDDIEHQILRKVFHDPRVHYAVNCASVGCPNLQKEAFEGSKLNQQLDAAAADYINSNRGAVVKNNRLAVSKIYSWFSKDFGSSDEAIIRHLKKYAKQDLKQKLKSITTIDSSFYDWSLNDQKNK